MIKPVEPNSVSFGRTIRDPHGRRNKIIEAIILVGGSIGVGFILYKLLTDKFEKKGK